MLFLRIGVEGSRCELRGSGLAQSFRETKRRIANKSLERKEIFGFLREP
jgi:hypothetical protein